MSVLVNVIGVGFDAFYNPLAPPFFTCTYKASGVKDVATPATVVAGEKHSVYYTIQCMSPGNTARKTKFTLSVSYTDGKGTRVLSFQGKKGRDAVDFDMVWTGVTAVGSTLIMDVEGLDLKSKYTCTFTDANNEKYKKINDAAFVGGDKYKLSCGKQPTGFKIKGTKSLVAIKITKSGTSEVVQYTGTGTAAQQYELDACQNGVQDGSETDVDCGGLCSQKCGTKKKCKVAGDCSKVRGARPRPPLPALRFHVHPLPHPPYPALPAGEVQRQDEGVRRRQRLGTRSWRLVLPGRSGCPSEVCLPGLCARACSRCSLPA